MIEFDVPGRGRYRLAHLLCDLNGTLSRDGVLAPTVSQGIRAVAGRLEVHVVTSDTRGLAEEVLAGLPLTLHRTSGTGCSAEKLALLEKLGAGRTVALGNGSNDRDMVEAAALGICIIGLEGAASETMAAADMVVVDPGRAFDGLLDPRLLVSTLRR